MPELPEVETVRRGLQPVLEGARVTRVSARRPDLRFPLPPEFVSRIEGHTVEALGRRAKYLTMHLDSGPVLICHLGMTGSFRIESGEGAVVPGEFHRERSKDGAHDHVVFDVVHPKSGPARIVYNDPRRFGFMLFAESDAINEHPMLAELGVEPTGNALDGAMISELFRGKAAPLKAAMLDQTLIAGLGNIYVCEALWRSGLSPRRAAGTIAAKAGHSSERADRLATSVRDVIAEAIEAGGSSLRDYIHTDGSLGYFQKSFNAYDREGEACQRPGCSGTIRRIVQSGRSTFYCPVHQR